MSAACQNSSYLSDEEKDWNPYKAGQVLLFGTQDGRRDTIIISYVADHQFADGLAAPQNERLKVLAKLTKKSRSRGISELRFLYISAKTTDDPTLIDFELTVSNGSFWGKAISINVLEEYNEEFLNVPYRPLHDVLRIEYVGSQALQPEDIKIIYWSKSVGYVKCQKMDGTIWELINIIDSP